MQTEIVVFFYSPWRGVYSSIPNMGLGLPSFTAETNIRKWRILSRLQNGSQTSNGIAQVLLGRVGRESNVLPIFNHPQILSPSKSNLWQILLYIGYPI
jgi:hypothetical protein